jgi:hypothetical protein
MNRGAIGELAAALMDDVDRHFGEQAEIGAVCLIVEARTPDGSSAVLTKFSDPRRHVILGMLEVARMSARGS